MSLLSQVSTGLVPSANMNILHGPPGVGKTTFASQFPKPIIADIEDGSRRIKNVTRLGSDKLPNFASLEALLTELLNTTHDFKTLVIDSATVLEKYCETDVCAAEKVTSIKDVPWGGGPEKVRERLQTLVLLGKQLQTKKQMEVFYIAHTQVKPFTDPHLNVTYDRNVLQCGDKFAHILTSAADNVYFCKYDVEAKSEKNKPKAKAFGDGSRIMYTEWRPGFEAKNRLGLPFELSLDYKAYIEALESVEPKPVEQIKSDIEVLLSKAPEDTQKAVREAMTLAKEDQVKLIRIKAKLLTVVSA